MREALDDPSFSFEDGPLDPAMQPAALSLIIQPDFIGTNRLCLPEFHFTTNLLVINVVWWVGSWLCILLGCGHLKSMVLQPQQYQVFDLHVQELK